MAFAFHSHRVPALICAPILALTLAAAGCGDTDDGLSRADYVAQADAVCAAGNARIDALTADLTSPPTGAAATELVGTVADDIERQVDEIDAIEPPDELSDDVTTLLEQARAAIAAVRADPGALFSGDAFAEANATAERIGLTACAG